MNLWASKQASKEGLAAQAACMTRLTVGVTRRDCLRSRVFCQNTVRVIDKLQLLQRVRVMFLIWHIGASCGRCAHSECVQPNKEALEAQDY